MCFIINLICIGVVIEVDWENWFCWVKMGDFEINWISWLMLCVGNVCIWW